MLALWNLFCSYSIGAEPIPPGSAKRNKKNSLCVLPPGRRPYGPEAASQAKPRRGGTSGRLIFKDFVTTQVYFRQELSD